MKTYIKRSTKVKRILEKHDIEFRNDNLFGEIPVFVTNDDISTIEKKVNDVSGDFLDILDAVFIGNYQGDYIYNSYLIEG